MMRLRALGLAVSIGAVSAVARPAPTHACSCAVPGAQPRDGATGVPLNVRIWLPDMGFITGQAEMPRLFQQGGQDVPFVVGAIQHAVGMRLLVLTPRSPLAPRTTYQFTASAISPARLSTFTTGDTSDSSVPAVPDGRVTHACAARTPGSSCGESYRALRFGVATEDLPMIVLTTGGDPPPPALDQLPASWPPQPNPVTFGGYLQAPQISLGMGACSYWPFFSAQGHVFYGAIDLAGNFSGWRTGGPVSLPAVPTTPSSPGEYQCRQIGDGGLPPDSVDAGQDAPVTDASAPDTTVAPEMGTHDAGSSRDAAASDTGPSGTSQGGGGCSVSGDAPVGLVLPALLLMLVAALARPVGRPSWEPATPGAGPAA